MTSNSADGTEVARQVMRLHRVFAWPTILMAVGSFIGLIVVTTLALQEMLPGWLGFISGGLLFLPFHLFSFIHLSHHRFTNSDRAPDFWLHSKGYLEAVTLKGGRIVNVNDFL